MAAPAKVLRINDIAPDFSAETTVGPINFYEYVGDSWCILFSHPADYTPVCTTELGKVATLKNEWAARNCKVLALSCDPLEMHMSWKADIALFSGAEVEYPIIADEKRDVAQLYNMLDESNKHLGGLPETVRSVFILNPMKKIVLTISYPAAIGRNFDEILRALDALQTAAAHKVVTPEGWLPGKKVIVLKSVPLAEAEAKYPDLEVVTPYLRFTADPNLPK